MLTVTRGQFHQSHKGKHKGKNKMVPSCFTNISLHNLCFGLLCLSLYFEEFIPDTILIFDSKRSAPLSLNVTWGEGNN